MVNGIEGGIPAGGALGCNVNVCLWLDRYAEIENKVRSSGQFTNEKAIKQEASRQFILGVYVPDVKSIVNEWEGKELTPGPDYLVTDNGLVLASSGESLGEMFITKRQDKGIEDTDETRTLKLAQRAIFQSEKAEVYFPVHNKVSSVDQIKYVARWKRQGNLVKTGMIRIANGVDKTITETHATLARGLQGQFAETRLTPAAFIFSNISPRDIESHLTQVQPPRLNPPRSSSETNNTPGLKKEIPPQPTQAVDVVGEVVKEVGQVTTNVARDTKGGIVAAYRFLVRETKKKDPQKENPAKAALKRVVIFKRQELVHRRKEVLPKPTLEKRRQKVDIQPLVVLAAETGVGVGAALWGLKLMSREKPVEVKKRRIKQRRRQEVQSRKMPTFSKEVFHQRGERKRKMSRRVVAERRVRPPKKKIERKNLTTAKTKEEIKRVETPHKKEKRRARRRQERQPRRRRLEKSSLTKSLKEIKSKPARVNQRKERKTVPPTVQKEKRPRRRETITLTKFALTWLLWSFLRPPGKDNSHILIYEGKAIKKPSERLPTHEAVHWLMLAIIWYLAQIREQGVVRSNVKYQMSKRKNKSAHFPPQGIIFVGLS